MYGDDEELEKALREPDTDSDPDANIEDDIDYNEFGDEDADVKSVTFPEHFWDNLGTDGPIQLERIKKLVMERPISSADLQYLQSKFMFLDIANGDAPEAPSDNVTPRIITARSGWVILDRGDRLTTGPGRLVFGAYREEMLEKVVDEESGEGEAGGGDSDKPNWIFAEGTLVKQFFDTAIELIDMAADRWPVAIILNGYFPMQRVAWMAAQERGFTTNYEPNDEDKSMYETIKRHTSAFTKKSKTPTPKA